MVRDFTPDERQRSKERDMVNSPAHYTSGSIECIDYMKEVLSAAEYIGYLRGNMAKYLHRWRYKNGIEDLKKARWYLNKLIEYEEKVIEGRT